MSAKEIRNRRRYFFHGQSIFHLPDRGGDDILYRCDMLSEGREWRVVSVLRALALFGLVTVFLPFLAFAQMLDGDILVLTRPVNGQSASVLRVDPSNTQNPVVVLGPLPQLIHPTDIASLPNGSILILDADRDGSAAPMNPQGKGPGGLFQFDPITKNFKHIVTPEESFEPSGMALLSSGEAVITDLPAMNHENESPGPGPSMGRLFRVNLIDGEDEILIQSPQLVSPMDVAANPNQDLIIADAGGTMDLMGGFAPAGPGGLFKWVADTGDLLPLPISQNVLNPRRVDVSNFGTAVIGGFDVVVFPAGSDVPARLNMPIPTRSFTDLAWASDGRLLLLLDDILHGEGALLARDSWNQAHEIARSPMLAGAVALTIVPVKNQRVGILKNAVARGVDAPVWVELAMSHITNLGALDIRIEYDPVQATAGRPQLAPAAGNFLLTTNLGVGVVSISLVVDDFAPPVDVPVLGQAVLVRIPFNLNNTLENESRVPLIIHRASLAAYDNTANVAEIPVEPVDGEITVVRGLVGDINNDGDVNSGDAVLALQSGAGQRSLAPIQAARGDMNNDGRVNSGDALLILRTSTGLRPVEQF